MEGNAVEDIGVGIDKVQVFFIGRLADLHIDPALAGVEAPGLKGVGHFLQTGYFFAEAVEIFFGEGDNIGVFQCLYIEMCGLAGVEAFVVIDPPVFDTKFECVFFVLVIEAVDTEAAFCDEVSMAADVAFMQEVFFPGDGLLRLECFQ